MQRLVNAFVKSLKWLQTAKPEDIAATVPAEYHLGDKPLYISAIKATRETYSQTGEVTADGMKNALDLVAKTDASFNAAAIDLKKTFDGRFLQKANVAK